MDWYSSAIVSYRVHYSLDVGDEYRWWYRIPLSRSDCCFKPIAHFSANSHRWLRDFSDFLLYLDQPKWCPVMESNGFWKSMKQLKMCRPLCFTFSAISLRIKIRCVVHLSFLNPACSSDRCGSICTFNLSSNTIINTSPTWLNRAIVL